MEKFISLHTAPATEERDAFRARFLQRDAVELAAAKPVPGRLMVNVVDVVPHWPLDAPFAPAIPEPKYDAVCEIWFDSLEAARPALAEMGRSAAVYRVTDWVEKEEPRTPGAAARIKLFSLMHSRGDLGPDEFRQRWSEHVPIALRVHAACRQYVRHRVDEALTAGAPPLNGIGMLGFASMEDLERRLFDSREGVAEVIADTARFVGDRAVLFATEHVVLD